MAIIHEARTVILAAAPAILATMAEGIRRTRVEQLYAKAQTQTTLSPMGRTQLESYARTMHRNPPTARTIVGLLEWLVQE